MLKIFFAALFALVFNQGVYIFGLLHDFTHRRLHRYNHAAYRHHDSGCNLSERTGHQQESAGYLWAGYGEHLYSS